MGNGENRTIPASQGKAAGSFSRDIGRESTKVILSLNFLAFGISLANESLKASNSRGLNDLKPGFTLPHVWEKEKWPTSASSAKRSGLLEIPPVNTREDCVKLVLPAISGRGKQARDITTALEGRLNSVPEKNVIIGLCATKSWWADASCPRPDSDVSTGGVNSTFTTSLLELSLICSLHNYLAVC